MFSIFKSIYPFLFGHSLRSLTATLPEPKSGLRLIVPFLPQRPKVGHVIDKSGRKIFVAKTIPFVKDGRVVCGIGNSAVNPDRRAREAILQKTGMTNKQYVKLLKKQRKEKPTL